MIQRRSLPIVTEISKSRLCSFSNASFTNRYCLIFLHTSSMFPSSRLSFWFFFVGKNDGKTLEKVMRVDVLSVFGSCVSFTFASEKLLSKSITTLLVFNRLSILTFLNTLSHVNRPTPLHPKSLLASEYNVLKDWMFSGVKPSPLSVTVKPLIL